MTRKVENNGEVWEDIEHAYLLPEISGFSDNIGKEFAIDAIRHLAEKNAYHPVKQYLDGLGETEQLTDEEWNNLASLLLGANDELDQIVLKKFLISAVARIYQPGCYVRMVPVLQSKEQNIGKSTFFRLLAGDDFFCDSLGDLTNLTNDYITLHSNWIHEWGELDKLTPKESGTVKAFITKVKDDFRAPYDRSNKTYRRQSVIVGTCNRTDFLKDPTGNTRYSVIKVGTIDLSRTEGLRNKIWATARAKYLAGEGWELSKAEQTMSELNNSQFTDIDVWTPKIEHFLSTGITEVSLDRILDYLNIDTGKQTNHDAKRVRNILGQLGWVQDKNPSRLPGQGRQRLWRPQWSQSTDSHTVQPPGTGPVPSVPSVPNTVPPKTLAVTDLQWGGTKGTVKNEINSQEKVDKVQSNTIGSPTQETPPPSVEPPFKTVNFAVPSVPPQQNPHTERVYPGTEPGTEPAQNPGTVSVPSEHKDKDGNPLAIGDKVQSLISMDILTVVGFRDDGKVIDCYNSKNRPSPLYWHQCRKVVS